MAAMGTGFDAEYFPDSNKTAIYLQRYRQYIDLGDFIEQQISRGNDSNKNQQTVSSSAMSEVFNHE
jgi:hypothetical protein